MEKQAAKAGLGDVKATWLLIDGGNVINDAMLAGTLDIAGTGAPGFAANKRGAAEIFARGSAVKVAVDEVLVMLNDKDAQFSVTPNKVMDFADFMHLAGSIKVKPASWTDLFIPQLHSRGGS